VFQKLKVEFRISNLTPITFHLKKYCTIAMASSINLKCKIDGAIMIVGI